MAHKPRSDLDPGAATRTSSLLKKLTRSLSSRIASEALFRYLFALFIIVRLMVYFFSFAIEKSAIVVFGFSTLIVLRRTEV